MSLLKKTIKGIFWVSSGKVIFQITQFITTIILARLLTPEDYGLVAMIYVFVGFLNIISNWGITAAIIQKESLNQSEKSTSFYVNFIVGVLLSGIFFISSDLISDLYNRQELVLLVRIFSISFVFSSIISTYNSFFIRDLDFKNTSIIEGISTIVGATCAIIMAYYYNSGVYSLVAQHLINQVSKVILLQIIGKWLPSLTFNIHFLKEIWGFSSNLFKSNLLNYFSRNGDSFLIGKFIGDYELGIYNRAYSIMLLPINNVTSILTKVMFPVLSKIKDNPLKVKINYLKSLRMIALITLPMVMGLMIVAKNFVVVILGEQWIDMVIIVQILCLVALKQPLGTTTGWIYQSQGRTDLMFKWNIISSSTNVLAFSIGIFFGIKGVAIAYVIKAYLLWYHGITIPGNLIGLKFKEFIINLKECFFNTLIMSLSILLVTISLKHLTNVTLLLFIQISTGVSSYVLASILIYNNVYKELKQLFREHLFSKTNLDSDKIGFLDKSN